MSCRAKVQVKQPEYGMNSLSHWVQGQAYQMLTENGVSVYTGDEGEYADKWEIERGPALQDFIEKLEANPNWFNEYLSAELHKNEHGKDLLDLLKEGEESAVVNGYDFIIIEWF